MNNKNIVKNDVFVFFLLLIIFYTIFRYVGTFNEGYNIVEDYYVIKTHQSLETDSFTSVFKQLMRAELEGTKRFRPFWVFYAMTTIKMFGVDLLLINIYVAFLCIVTSFLLYKFCLNIGFTYTQSVLFSLITLIGPAIIIYIRPIDAEIIGMLMLSSTLFFLSKSIYSEKKKLFYHFCFIISLTLTILSKESFMVTVPAVLFLYVLTYSSKNNIGIIQSLKKNKIILILSFLILLFFLLFLIKTVGFSKNNGYTGVDVNLLSGKVLLDFINTVFKTSIIYVILLGIVIILISIIKKHNLNFRNYKKSIYKLFLVFIFMLMIIVPQFILYYKTGFFVGRYYLPYLMGFAFLLIYMLKVVYESKSIPIFAKYFYLSIIIIFLLFQLKSESIPALTQHADGCKANTEMLNFIAKNPNKELLVVMDPVQNYYTVYSLKIFLDYLKGQVDYKFDFINMDNVGQLYADPTFFNKVLIESKKNLGKNSIDSSKSNSDIKNILIFWSLDKKFLEKNKVWFNENNFKKKKIGFYTLYSK